MLVLGRYALGADIDRRQILYFVQVFQLDQQVAGWVVVEAPFALFQEEIKVSFRDAVVTTTMLLGLVPDVLDAIDMVVRISEEFRVIDPVMM